MQEYNIEETKKLLKYINSPLTKEVINILYNANNINFDKCQLYHDFTKSLFMIIFDTYLGDDFTNQEQQKNHFIWCWEKNIKNFNEEGINIYSNKLFDYFYEFTKEVYYSSPDNEKKIGQTDIMNLWATLFKYDGPKTNVDMDMLIEVYKIFEKSRSYSLMS